MGKRISIRCFILRGSRTRFSSNIESSENRQISRTVQVLRLRKHPLEKIVSRVINKLFPDAARRLEKSNNLRLPTVIIETQIVRVIIFFQASQVHARIFHLFKRDAARPTRLPFIGLHLLIYNTTGPSCSPFATTARASRVRGINEKLRTRSK